MNSEFSPVAARLRGVSKTYPGSTFRLQNVDLEIPTGCALGLLGKNGAGKSTLIGLLTGALLPDRGEISLWGQTGAPTAKAREALGYVPDEMSFPETLNPLDIGRFLEPLFPQWDGALYARLLQQFGLPPKQTVKGFSRGMKMKLSLAAALSHHPRLLLLDEATAGLDPLAREDILDLLRDYLLDESHSILFSSHQTTDLERLCDYIAIIHQGRVLLWGEKDALLDEYVLLSINQSTLEALPQEALFGPRQTPYGVEVLAKRDGIPAGFAGKRPSLEELMIFLCKEADAK